MAARICSSRRLKTLFSVLPSGFTGSRGSKLGDLGPYGKQAVQFYTQTKTIISRWFEDGSVPSGVNTTISLK